MEQRENGHQLKNLRKLSTGDFEIKDGQPDIITWIVLNAAGRLIGRVSDLLFDEDEQKVRFLVLNLSGNIWKLEEREVLIPIGTAELDKSHDHVILPNITAQQINALPDYINENAAISTAAELYSHTDFDERNLYARRQSVSYEKNIPYQVITWIYQEEDEAENAFRLLLEKGFPESSLKVTPYNPLNSVTDLQGNTNTEFIGDGSRDEYIFSITANSAEEAEFACQLLGPATGNT